MNQDRVSKLSEGQRECLRLVLLMKSSKEIARDLSISRHTVDQRLRVASQILGTANRFEAARALANAESGLRYQNAPYQTSVYQAPYLLGSLQPELMGAPDQQPTELGSTPIAVREVQAPLHMEATQSTRWPLPLPVKGQERNELSLSQRLMWIVALAIAAALSFGILLSGLEALKRALS